MNALLEKLHRETEANGVISFARFMELALYYPGEGYYEQSPQTIGRRGDYYTSVSVGDLFGQLLAAQFTAWSKGLPGQSWQIVEAGAHDGQLARDILVALRSSVLPVDKTLTYGILEPSARRRGWQQANLREFTTQVKWWTEWDSFAPGEITGIIFANEFLDAMPVHRLGWDAGRRTWFEWGVHWNGQAWCWARKPDSEIQAQALWARQADESGWGLTSELAAVLPQGFTTEVRPGAAEWWRTAASTLERGWLITFDYGYYAAEFFCPDKADGTLCAYRHHRCVADVLSHPGEQDLTAAVNFSVLQKTGEAVGLQTVGLYSQGQFLTRIIAAHRQAEQPEAVLPRGQVRQFKTLMHPDHLGRALRVLVQKTR